MTTLNERYETGLKNLKIIDKEAGEKVVESLIDCSPDLVKYIIEYGFGDVYNRTELVLKSKELTVVAALTAMGNAAPQLKVHIHGALNVGANIAEIQEVILQMSSYAGFPSAINGMLALKDVVAERKLEGKQDEAGVMHSSSTPKGVSRYALGAQTLNTLHANQVENLESTFKDISPDLARLVIEYGFSDIFSRPALDIKHREMATIAALTAMGTATPQLKFHIKAALNIGVSQAEIREIMILMSIYCGFPAAINGTLALKGVINESDVK